MPPRPKGSLDDLTVPKVAEHAAPAPASTAPTGAAPKGYAHTLSLRLTAEQYRRLRMHVRHLEDEGQGRVTHQGIIEAALGEYLDRHGST